ncbi:hypothetical protein [Magnetospirillum moscoviense]|nr:hypothetical protein [Magnetospirillum moscoviense]
MLSKMLIHGLIATFLVGAAASVYAAAFAPSQGLMALAQLEDE